MRRRWAAEMAKTGAKRCVSGAVTAVTRVTAESFDFLIKSLGEDARVTFSRRVTGESPQMLRGNSDV